ncbi:MAG: glucose 1-dehydrogenase [Actinobacteria bacterium]|nr:glucose 1-dehydrogenase [Actinomycetota bacterium]
MAGRVEGKVALISGGGRGQGAAHARLLAEEGAAVVFGDILDEPGAALATELTDAGLDARYVHLDVTKLGDWEAAVALCESEFGGLDIVVNNAGIVGSTASVADETDAGWEQLIAVNQTGVLYGMRVAIEPMRLRGGGSIINTSSIWGIAGTEEYIGYQATKGAVRLMTKSAALTYAPDKIRVNSVLPGLVMTPMLDDEPEESIAELARTTPLGRGADPREISYAVLYLACDESAFVTGIDLVIDGGFLAR